MAENKSKFINPYNFVPLGKSCSRSEYKKGNLTGVIEYSLLTKTPLFIPDTESEKVDANGHRTFKFFSYGGDKPVIPGSEMRGMLRSYYEILTNSCMSAVDTEPVLSKRTSEVYKAGLIKKCADDKYELYNATDCLLRTARENSFDVIEKPSQEDFKVKSYKQSELREGQKVYISFKFRGSRIKPLVESLSLKETKFCKKEAYVIKGEAGPDMPDKKKEKHCCHIFMLDNRNIDVIATVNIGKLQKVIDLYQNQSNGEKSYDEYKKQLKRFIKGELAGEYFPVYYSEIKDTKKSIIMLSPASITREVYDTKIRDMIRDYGACKDANCLCYACKLFGMLNGTTAVTSRIRITDMKHKIRNNNKIYVDLPWTLKPLSSPKLQNLEFYMKKPAHNAWFWTYDYYIDDNGKVHINNKPEINGRKYYWHHPVVDKGKITTSERNDKNITVTPVKDGNLFEGKIYFECLTEDELTSLVYLLNVGESGAIEERTHGYKLGHAKPFGFGSVALRVKSILVRSVENNNGNIERRITNKTDEYGMISSIINEECKKDIEKITYFDAIGSSENISYPIADERRKSDNEDEGFVWFVNNHMAYKYDKRSDKKVEIGAPNQRTQMVYKEHIQPMIEELVLVDKNMSKLIQSRNNQQTINRRDNNSNKYNSIKHNKNGRNRY